VHKSITAQGARWAARARDSSSPSVLSALARRGEYRREQ